MEQSELKMTPVKFFYDYYTTSFDMKTNNFVDKLKVINDKILIVTDYIKENFTEIPVFGKLDFDDFSNVDIPNYIRSHGSFYRTVAEKSFLYKLEELAYLYTRKKSLENQLGRHKSMFFSAKEFKWLIVETHKLMVNQMIQFGKRFRISTKLGYFAVSSRKVSTTEPPRLNHKQTKFHKERLLAEGKTLKSKENPNGEEYRVFFTDTNVYRLKWFRNNVFLFTPEMINYRYKSITGTDSIIGRIYKLIKQKPEIKLLYRN